MDKEIVDIEEIEEQDISVEEENTDSMTTEWDPLEYLALEQKRSEQIQNAKDIHEKRIITSFQMTVSLIAGVMVVYLLKDNPTILVNIIYISGILGAFWIWKKSRKNC